MKPINYSLSGFRHRLRTRTVDGLNMTTWVSIYDDIYNPICTHLWNNLRNPIALSLERNLYEQKAKPS